MVPEALAGRRGPCSNSTSYGMWSVDTLPQLFEVDQFDDVYIHLLNNPKVVGYKVKVLELILRYFFRYIIDRLVFTCCHPIKTPKCGWKATDLQFRMVEKIIL